MAVYLLCIILLSGGEIKESKSVEFMGFSRDESLSVWKVHVQREQLEGRVIDEFDLYQVVRSSNNEVMGAIRGPWIQRRSPSGRNIRCHSRILEAANQDWRDADPHSNWRKLKKKGRIRAKALPMTDSAIRVKTDPSLNLVVEGGKGRIRVSSRLDQPNGYRVIGRTMDGNHVSLGDFYEPARRGDALISEVRVSYSRTGMHVAVLSQFYSKNQRNDSTWLGRVIALPEAIATPGIGTMRVVFSGLRTAQDTFESFQTNLDKEYAEFVGRHW